jgi:NADP-reducing hydrogenase subunit HndB
MKSLEELKALRDVAKKKIEMRDSDAQYRVVVGMATCGIAAGARPVLNAMVDALSTSNYSCVVTQTGCIGMCTLEPIVEIYDSEQTKTTYVKMTPEKALEVLESHVKHGQVLEAYTVKAVVKEK